MSTAHLKALWPRGLALRLALMFALVSTLLLGGAGGLSVPVAGARGGLARRRRAGRAR